MTKGIEIPEGYEARIEGNKVIIELKQSDDEKIKRAISYAIGQSTHSDGTLIDGITREQAMAYLEKQKKQNPAILNKENDSITKQFVLNQLFSLKEHINFGRSWEYIPLVDRLIKAISESIVVITPNEELPNEKLVEWSEEDEKKIKWFINLINSQSSLSEEWKNECRNWLKSLRPQPKEDIDAIAKREYERGKVDGYWEGYKKAQESMSFHYDFPAFPSIKRSCFEGGPCTNPHMDCINCPRKDGGTYTTLPYTTSGESKLESHWKPSEEQMTDLQCIVHDLEGAYLYRSHMQSLHSLIDDLKKL